MKLTNSAFARDETLRSGLARSVSVYLVAGHVAPRDERPAFDRWLLGTHAIANSKTADCVANPRIICVNQQGVMSA